MHVQIFSESRNIVIILRLVDYNPKFCQQHHPYLNDKPTIHHTLATRIAGVKTVQNKTTTLFTVADVAAALAVSPTTVYQMIWSREIYAVRVRGCWRISQPDLIDYAQEIGAWWLFLDTSPSTADTGATRDGATCHSQPVPSRIHQHQQANTGQRGDDRS